MATVSEKPADLAVPEWAASSAVDEKVDRYLAARLRAVGADYKSVAITTFLLAAGVGLMTWLAVGVLADHWIVPGGLGRGSRLAWLVVGGLALLAAIAHWVAPLIRYRVNLVYAARTIERANPGLHNDVVNTVLARARPDRSPPVVLASLEHRAAKRLSKLPVDVVADRSAALRLAVVLAALVAALCLYAVLSPKSLATSLARLAAPLARIQPPTRVQIEEPTLAWKPGGDRAANAPARPLVVVDGATTMIRNRQLVVASRIRGLQAGERPAVEATTISDDGSFDRGASWLVGMESTKEGTFEVRLPEGGRGLGHSLVLAIVAGDARSEPVRVTVVDEPSLLVREVRLAYPSYTRREPETLEWQGDVSGPEGTRVTLSAESNEPLDTASIDFACDGKSLVKMRIDPKDLARASGSFDLRMAADGSGPWERQYQLVFTPRSAGNAGDAKLAGIAHRIDVIADKVPEVRIVVPEKAVMKVPPREPVVVAVEARDPDYGLRSVVIELELERGGERMPREPVTVLNRDFREPFSGRGSIVPSSVGAVAGDTLHYRAAATDVKTPSPNVAHTKWYSLEIDPAAPPARNPPGASTNDAGGADQEDGDGDGKQDGASGEDDRKGKGKEKGEGGENADGQDPGDGSSGGGESEGGGSQGRGANDQQGRSGNANGKSNEGEKQQNAKQGEGETGAGAPEQGDAGEQAEGAGKTPGSSSPSKAGEDGKSDAAEGSQPASNDTGKGGGNDVGKTGQGEQRQGEQQGGERGQRQQAADAASDAKKGPSRPVASDGTNDGEAIERILEQRRGEGQEGEPQPAGAEEQAGPQKNDAGDTSAGQSGDKKDAASGNPDGQNPDGPKPNGQAEKNEGDKKDGAEQQGQNPQGQNPQGQDPQGQDPQGQDPQGQDPQGQDPQGQDPQGQDPQGQDPQGQDPRGDTERGKKEQGENKQGEPQPNGECRPEEGKPCGGADCPTCKGGGSKSGGGGGAGSGGGSKQGEAAESSAKPGQGEAGGGEPSDSGQPAADQEGTESGRAEADPRGGKPGGPKQGEQRGFRDGASQEGASQKDGSGAKTDPSGGAKPGGGQPGEDLANDDPSSDREPSDQPGAGGRAGRGFGGWNAGEKSAAPAGAAASKDAEWGEQDLSHARNAVDLAVEHLRRSVEEGRTDVIDSLGWTREQAQAFLERWARMAREAKEGGLKKQEEFDRAVRSLGLTPAGVRRTREPPPDARGGQAEGRRSRPPFEYREQFEAFTRGAQNR